MIVSTFLEVWDASADNSASLQDASFQNEEAGCQPPDCRCAGREALHISHALSRTRSGEQWRCAWLSAADPSPRDELATARGWDDEGLELLLFPGPQSPGRPVPDSVLKVLQKALEREQPLL